MHGKATIQIQLEGNSAMEEQIGMCYLRDDCFAPQKNHAPLKSDLPLSLIWTAEVTTA